MARRVNRRVYVLVILGASVILTLATLASATSHPGISSTYPSGSPDVSTSGLIASYDMETIVSSNAKDFSPSGADLAPNNGITIGGATGAFNGATNFDGVNDYLSHAALSTPSVFSVSMWVKPTSKSAVECALATCYILLELEAASNTYLDYGVNGASKFSFTLGIGASVTITFDSTSSLDAWHYVAFTYDGSNMKLTVDGTTKTVAQTGTFHSWTQLRYGQFEAGYFYKGILDEATIWSRVLSSADIAVLGSSQSFPNVPPVVSTDPASAISCASAILNGNLTNKGAATSLTVGFVYSKDPSYSMFINVTVGTKTANGTFNTTLFLILDASTVYYYKAWANGGTFGFAFGNSSSFTTLGCEPIITICGANPYSNANLWTVGFLIGVAVVLGAMASIRFQALWILSGIAVLFIAFYSGCMGGFLPAILVVVVGIFAILEGIPAREGK